MSHQSVQRHPAQEHLAQERVARDHIAHVQAPPSALPGEAAPLSYARAEPTAAKGFYGKWSDELCSCYSDPPTCLCACCCWDIFLIWRVWSLLEKSVWMQVPLFGRQGRHNSTKLVGCFVVLVLLDFITYYELIVYLNLPTSGKTLAFNIQWSAVPPWLQSLMFSILMGTLLLRMAVQLGAVERFRVNESMCASIIQVLCCGCCALLRIGRHVDKYDDVCNFPTVGPPVRVSQ